MHLTFDPSHHTEKGAPPITVDEADIASVHLPVLRFLEGLWKERQGRLIVFLAGPPGAGKSTITALWEHLAAQYLCLPLQALPMDGFHFPNAYLDSQRTTVDGVEMPLKRLKGRPETFDVGSLEMLLRSIKAGQAACWPSYSRTLHDPISDAIAVAAEGILIVEGLYMLLDLPGWRELRGLADCAIQLECHESVRLDDLLARKLSQGWSREQAMAHYQMVNRYAADLLMQHCQSADIVIQAGTNRHPTLLTKLSQHE